MDKIIAHQLPYPISALYYKIYSEHEPEAKLRMEMQFIDGVFHFLSIVCLADAIAAQAEDRDLQKWLAIFAKKGPGTRAFQCKLMVEYLNQNDGPFLTEIEWLFDPKIKKEIDNWEVTAGKMIEIRNWWAHMKIKDPQEELKKLDPLLENFIGGLRFLQNYALGQMVISDTTKEQLHYYWHGSCGQIEYTHNIELISNNSLPDKLVMLIYKPTLIGLYIAPFAHIGFIGWPKQIMYLDEWNQRENQCIYRHLVTREELIGNLPDYKPGQKSLWLNDYLQIRHYWPGKVRLDLDEASQLRLRSGLDLIEDSAADDIKTPEKSGEQPITIGGEQKEMPFMPFKRSDGYMPVCILFIDDDLDAAETCLVEIIQHEEETCIAWLRFSGGKTQGCYEYRINEADILLNIATPEDLGMIISNGKFSLRDEKQFKKILCGYRAVLVDGSLIGENDPSGLCIYRYLRHFFSDHHLRLISSSAVFHNIWNALYDEGENFNLKLLFSRQEGQRVMKWFEQVHQNNFSDPLLTQAIVRNKFPYPLASLYRNIYHFSKPEQRILPISLFVEGIFRFLFLVNLADAATLGASRGSMQKWLTALKQPSMGKIFNQLKSITKELSKLGSPFISEISEILNQEQQTPWEQAASDLIDIRNFYCHNVSCDFSSGLSWQENLLQQLLSRLEFLRNYFLGIGKDLKFKGLDIYNYYWYMSRGNEEACHPLEIQAQTPIIENVVLLMHMPSERALYLSPFFEWRNGNQLMWLWELAEKKGIETAHYRHPADYRHPVQTLETAIFLNHQKPEIPITVEQYRKKYKEWPGRIDLKLERSSHNRILKEIPTYIAESKSKC